MSSVSMLPSLGGLAMFLFQDDVASAQDIHRIMIFTGVIAGVLLVVLLARIIAGILALVLVGKVEKAIDEVKHKAYPLIDKVNPIMEKTRGIVDDLKPKIESISATAVHFSDLARAKADEVGKTVSEVNTTVRDVNGRAKVQVAHVDAIVSEALRSTHEVSRSVQNGVKAPVRQIAGIVTGLKVGIETFLARSGFARRSPARPAPYTYAADAQRTPRVHPASDLRPSPPVEPGVKP